MQRVIPALVTSLLVGGSVACSSGLGGSDGGVPTVCDSGTISITSNIPSCMWAPNHDMVLFDLNDISVTTTGGCTAPTLSIIGVTSNQPALGGGQGHFSPDYTFNSTGVCLRSERQGTSSGDRVYSITVQATDGTTTIDQVIQVTVPHDQSGTKCAQVDSSRVVAPNDPRCN
jgi:hypothetical protein